MPRHTPKYPERVEALRTLLGEGKTYSQIAESLGVTRSSVSSMVRRWVKGIHDTRIKEVKTIFVFKGALDIPPASAAMRALAEFDPVIARALRHREALTKTSTTDGA